MDALMFRSVFLFGICQAVASRVEPPANVTMQCRNLDNVLKWDYGPFPSGLEFRVTLKPYSLLPQTFTIHPPQLQANIPLVSDLSEFYLVHVTAAVGQEESVISPPEGLLFSYYAYTPDVDKICVVDFPLVNVTAKEDGEVLFRFTHPWVLYRPKLPTAGSDPKPRKTKRHRELEFLPEFTYKVSVQQVNQTKPPETFFCDEMVCEGKVGAHPAEGRVCLKVGGELKGVTAEATQEFCAAPQKQTPSSHAHLYIVLAILASLGVAAFVLWMLYRKKTRPSTFAPESLKPLQSDQERVCVPELEPTSPDRLLLFMEEPQAEKSTPVATVPAEPTDPAPSAVDEGVCDVVQQRGEEERGYSRDLDSGEEEIGDEPPNEYEKRPVLLQMGPEDKIEGYF